MKKATPESSIANCYLTCVWTFQISPKEALMKEIRFALRCNMSTKPVKHAPSTPSSGSSGSGSTGIGRSIARSLLQLNAFQRLAGGEKEK